MIKQQHRRRSSRIEHTDKLTWRCWECAAQPHLLRCCWWVKPVERKLFKETNCLEPFDKFFPWSYRCEVNVDGCGKRHHWHLDFFPINFTLPFVWVRVRVTKSDRVRLAAFHIAIQDKINEHTHVLSFLLENTSIPVVFVTVAPTTVPLGKAIGWFVRFYFKFTKSNILSHKEWSKRMYNCAENVLMALSELRNTCRLWHCSCDNLKPTVHLRKLIALNILSFINTT